MSENTNPQGSVDTTIGGAANAFMSILDPQTKEAEADPEVRADDSSDYESSYDEPQAEESDVSAEEAEYQEEVVEEAPKYRVKVNGEELEVSLDELLNGYSRTADYQKKTQSLAEQRKAVEAERVKIDEAAKTYLRTTTPSYRAIVEPTGFQRELARTQGNRSYCLCN